VNTGNEALEDGNKYLWSCQAYFDPIRGKTKRKDIKQEKDM